MDRAGSAREVGAQANPGASEHQTRGGAADEVAEGTWWPGCLEKPLANVGATPQVVTDGPYRKPPLVGRGKRLKVDERSFVKELGKLAP